MRSTGELMGIGKRKYYRNISVMELIILDNILLNMRAKKEIKKKTLL